MKDTIDIAFNFDKNYYRQAVVAMTSLLHFVSKNEKDLFYNLHLLITDDVMPDIQHEIKQQLSPYKNLFSLHFYNIGEIFSSSYECRGITNICYGRLMLHRIIPETIDKLIYSDVDVLFKTDLSEINKIDITNRFFAACKDCIYNSSQGRSRVKNLYEYWNNELKNIGKNYHNSGFLLINLNKFRKENLDNQIIELSQRKFNFQDQDVLNTLFVEKQNELLTLPPQYAVLQGLHSRDNYINAQKEGIISENELNEVLNKPLILHYAGAKPWDTKIFNGKIWWNFVKKHTNYYGYFKKRFNKINNIPNFLQRIFSVKNEYSNNIKHKVITLFGIKIKF